MSRPTPLVEVARRCGHREVLRVAGPFAHRAGIIEQLERQECAACFGWPVDGTLRVEVRG